LSGEELEALVVLPNDNTGDVKREYRLRLSQEEHGIIQRKESVVLMGRSGTGKTTCAVLRMWVLDAVFRKNEYLGPLLSGNPKSEKGSDKGSYFNQLFVTVSPVLCDHVKSFWKGLQLTHNIPNPTRSDLPNHLQGIPRDFFPLVMTFAWFLELLDNTLPPEDRFLTNCESITVGK